MPPIPVSAPSSVPHTRLVALFHAPLYLISRAVMKFGDLRAQMDCLLASAMLESFPRDARWAGFQELNLPSDSLLSSSLLPIPQLHFRVSNFLGFRRSWTKLESNMVVRLAGLSAPLPQQRLRLRLRTMTQAPAWLGTPVGVCTLRMQAQWPNCPERCRQNVVRMQRRDK